MGTPEGSGVHLVVVIGVQVVVHAVTTWRQRHILNQFFYSQNYWEWNAIPKVQPSSRGDSGLPLGRGYRSALELAIYARVALTGILIVDPLLVDIF